MLPHFSIRFVLQCLLAITGYALVTVTTYAQTIRYVSSTGPNANPAVATSWANSTTNLQGAIDASQPGDQVWVAAGIYKPGGNTNTNRTISFSMKNGVTIYGGFVGTETALSQRPAINPVNDQPSNSTLSGEIGDPSSTSDNSHQVIYNPASLSLDNSAVLDGFVVTSWNDRGVMNDGRGTGNMCSPMFRYSSFQGNSTSGYGEAMHNAGDYGGSCKPVFISCIFQNNSVPNFEKGAAMYNSGSFQGLCKPVITDCVFQSNTASAGGAVYNYAENGLCTPIFNNCVFQDNLSLNDAGGAIYNYASSNGRCSPELTECLFLRNSAIRGGGIYSVSFPDSSSSNPILARCTFRDNSATESGGGIGSSGVNSNPILFNCSFQRNKAIDYGGALFYYNYGNSKIVSIELVNCLFDSNSANYGGAIYNYSAQNGTNNDPLLLNCSFIKNSAGLGGAILNFIQLGSCDLKIVNSSFLNNSAEGGGAVNNAGYRNLSNLTLTNCVLFGNGSDMTLMNSYNSTISATFCLFEPSSVSGIRGVDVSGPGNMTNLTVSPFASENSVTLANCSPAINTGNPFSTTVNSEPYSATALPPSDLLGRPRIFDGRVDMGAMEYQLPKQPSRLYVKATATGNHTGQDWTNAFTDLYTALAYPCSTSLSEIWVAAGTYKPGGNTNTNRNFSFSMRNGVAIYGGFVGTETSLSQRPAINPVNGKPSSSTLSGEIGDPSSTTDNSYHVISNPTGLTTTAILDGFIITGGNANSPFLHSSGGGVFNKGSDLQCNPLFRNCSFQDNTAYYGGAIYNDGSYGISNPVLVNCLFNNNLGIYNGGAMYNYADLGVSSPAITNCIFQQNSSSGGGAIYNYGRNGNSSPVLVNCTFLSNTASNYGGALYNYSYYEGIANPILTNCSFLGNLAVRKGGAIESYTAGGRTVLTNCVFYGNGGKNTFDNVFNYVIPTYSLFEPSAVSGVAGLDLSGPGNLTNVTVSPFASATSVALAPNSPAINAGDPATSSATVGMTDLSGNPRFVGRIDMGAVEFQEVLEVYTLKDGSWSDPSVWSVGRLPQLGERVRLKHTVSIPSATTALGLVLTYDPAGKLVHEAGSKVQLGDWGKF